MWEIVIKYKDDEDEKLMFTSRPVISEGPHLVAIRGEVEGELWLAGASVQEIRVRPPQNAGTV